MISFIRPWSDHARGRGLPGRHRHLPGHPVPGPGRAVRGRELFGGTSILITVGVLLDTLRQLESFLLMRHYDGFLKKGRVRGRF